MQNLDDFSGEDGSAEEPATKKQRRLTEADLGGPIEDEETARKKLVNAGFDPDKISILVEGIVPPDGVGEWDASPMMQFCAAGDLEMVRYLVSRGASTTERLFKKGDEDHPPDTSPDTPMSAAARMGQTHICKWLFCHGAKADVRLSWNGTCPLGAALRPWVAGRGSDTPEWLVKNGALSHSDGSPNMEAIEYLEAFSGPAAGFHRLLSWAQRTLDVNDGVLFVLLGTMPPKEYSDSGLLHYLISDMNSAGIAPFFFSRLSSEDRRVLWKMLPSQQRNSPLQMLSGTPGALELVAEFAGFVRGKYLMKILRAMENSLQRALRRARTMYDPDDDEESDDHEINELSYIEEYGRYVIVK